MLVCTTQYLRRRGGSKQLALISVSGNWGRLGRPLFKRFRGALKDRGVAAILWDFDSGGGRDYAATHELAKLVYAARGRKPIWAIANGCALSGAYLIASACDTVVCAPDGHAGGVHVITCRGDGRPTIHIGPTVPDLMLYPPASEAEQRRVLAHACALYDQFVTAVARNRATTTDDVRENYGVVGAEQALASRVVDHVGTLETTLEQLTEG